MKVINNCDTVKKYVNDMDNSEHNTSINTNPEIDNVYH